MSELSAYQLESRQTAIYPADASLLYLAVGLCDEAGEVAEKVESAAGVMHLTAEVKAALAGEIGDALWYAAQLATEAGLELEDCRAAAHQGQTSSLEAAALRLASDCGKVAGQIKKTARDDDGVLAGSRLQAVRVHLGAVLWSLDRLAGFAGSDLEGVAAANLEKILSRQARGVLRGSGDER